MEKLNSTIVIIDDDNGLKESNIGLFLELEMNFDSVKLFKNKEDGLEYIEKNLEKRIIVLLDLCFPHGTPDGHSILESIRKTSFLIPVLIWSAIDEDKETFSDLINNKSYAFLNKDASIKEIITKLKEAYNNANKDISIALEDWIQSHPDSQKEKPYMITAEGKQLSLNQILREVRLQTEIGKDFSKNLLKLTIDLLVRNKESLDD